MVQIKDRKEVYKQRAQEFENELNGLKKKDVSWSMFRFALILISFSLFYYYLDTSSYYFLIGSILVLVGFVFALKWHDKLRAKIVKCRNLLEINLEEIAYFNNDFTSFNDGKEYTDSQHLYAHDLDIFGPLSLFHRLNRTISKGGSDILAHELLYSDGENIIDKQKSVNELADQIQWRQNFQAQGREVEEDPKLLALLRDWLHQHAAPRWVISSWFTYLLTIICVGLLINWLIKTDLESFNYLSYAFIFNLLVVFANFKWIKKEYQYVDGISKSLAMYSRLLKQIEETTFQSEELNKLKEQLNSAQNPSSESVKKLAALLNSFDQMNNVVVLIFTNGIYLNHLHVLRGLYNWKEKKGINIEEWLRIVARFDYLNSLANLAYNHPDFVYPEITSEKKFTAKDLGHPFIKPENRVGNSVNFDEYQYIILTGSNMSGKSTLLRAIGVNMVLAKMGVPVCAREFSTYPFTLLSSMKQVDSLAEDRSYFQAEVIRLRSLLDVLEKDDNCFILLDEILRGTNSQDKKEGSRLFMLKLTQFKAKGVLATHDIDIADLAAQKPQIFNARYFESKVVDNELVFDYKLRPGICTTPNATTLMKAQGII